MKTNTLSRLTFMFLLSLLLTAKAMSQQQKKDVRPDILLREQTSKDVANSNYTYRLFVAPNKLYGYDIFKNGRIIFRQPALQQPAGDKQAALTEKSLADKAATMAIEKIKKGMPAELSREEIMKITVH